MAWGQGIQVWLVLGIIVLISSTAVDSQALKCPPQFKSPNQQREAGEKFLKTSGQAESAVACLLAALDQIGSGDAQTRGEVGVLLADAYEASGNIAKSVEQLQRVARDFPTSPVPPFKLGNQARMAERWEEAVAYYEKALEELPTFVNARVNLGMSLRGLNKLDDSIAAYRKSLTYAPERADIYVNLGVTLDAAGYPDEAKEAYETSIDLDPKLYQAYFNLGVLWSETYKDREKGIALYFKSLEIEPNFPDAYNTLGTVHTSMGRYAEAKKYLEIAIALRPTDSRFHNSMGILADQTGDAQAALKSYKDAIAKSGDSPAAIINAAKVLNSQARYNEAEQMCLEAIRVDPTYGEAFCQLGDVYKDSERIALALEAYMEGIKLTPSYEAGFCNFMYTATFACHWKDRSKHVARLREIMQGYLHGPDPLVHECVQPFQSLAYPFEPEELLEIAKFHANKAAVHIKGMVGSTNLGFHHPTSPIVMRHTRNKPERMKMRIGFVSADYKDHPVVKDLIHMFSMFDQAKLDVFCYALNPAGPGVGWETSGWHEDGGKGPHRLWRDRVAEHCTLLDLSQVRDIEAAAAINQRRMHMIFNIQGYTQGERNEIFALQPSPIQVSYKGFVGTLGADYITHMISDSTVAPPEYQAHFVEKMLYMPWTYVVNDYRQQHSEFRVLQDDKPIEREEYGLPAEATVIYCNFNQQYKIDAPTLKAWVQVLRQVPGSIMWLLRFGTSNAAEVTLRNEAVRMGLDDPERIVFTDTVPRRIHLHVKSLADVFLDTPQYNGHGTATDALWAGIPLVTFPVRKMASRAAASFVYASAGEGRTTLVRTMRDMVDVGVRLGKKKNHQIMQNLRRDLYKGRFTSPMWDTQRWVLGFQNMLRMLWESYRHQAETELPPDRVNEEPINRMHVILADSIPATPA